MTSQPDPPIIPQLWQRLASMDQHSPNFLSLLSLLMTADHSLTTSLRGDDAKATLGALDEVGCSFTAIREWSGRNLYYIICQLFRDGKIPNGYERNTLRVMRMLAHDSCQVPPRYLADPNALTVDRCLVAGGRFAVIRKGMLGDKAVAVRTLNPGSQTDPHDSVQKVCTAPNHFFESSQ